MAQPTTVRRIEVTVDAKDSNGQLKAIAKGFADVNKGINQTKGAVTSFRNAFLALQGLNFAGFGLTSLTQSLDAVQKLSDRLRLTEGSAGAANIAFSRLSGIANDNKTAIEDVATVYNRLNLSLRDTGISSEALLGLTDSLQKSFRISGATASEATAAVIQLSQGLASGQLRGQELRSVLEQNALIGEVLAKSLGIARGQLIKFAEKNNGISAEQFLKAVAGEFGNINQQASKLAPTIGETLTTNFNKLKVVANDLNQEFQIVARLSSVIDAAFKNLDVAAAILGVVAGYKAYTIAVLAATEATAAFNFVVSGSLFAKVASSPVTGLLVKIAVGLTSLAGATALATIGLVGLGASFVSSLNPVKEAEDRLKKVSSAMGVTIETGNRVEVVVSGVAQQFTRAAEASAVYKATQTELGKSFNQTFEIIINGARENLVLAKTNNDLSRTYIDAERALTPYQRAVKEFIETGKLSKTTTLTFKEALAAINQEFTKTGDLQTYNKRLKEIRIDELNKQWTSGTVAKEEFDKRLQEIQFGKLKPRINEVRGELAALNAEFGMFGNVQQYALKLSDLTLERSIKDFNEGRINLEQLNKAFAESDIRGYNIQLQQGVLTITEFNSLVAQSQLQQLNNSFRSGAIDVFEFNSQLIQVQEKFRPGSALFVGTANYIKQAGTLSQNIANGITQTFGRLENTFTEFTRTGRFAFREFAAGVIDDLNKIIVRALIIRPIAQGILGGLGGVDTGASSAGSSAGSAGYQSSFGFGDYQFAKGGAFNSGVEFFAKGGVVDRATMFGMRGGMGVMGEKGPEAILPLRRTGSGDLGVRAEAVPSNVIVNIVNQGGGEVEQRESTNANGERILDIIILSKVKEGFANGAFDRSLSQQYGLRRRGA